MLTHSEPVSLSKTSSGFELLAVREIVSHSAPSSGSSLFRWFTPQLILFHNPAAGQTSGHPVLRQNLVTIDIVDFLQPIATLYRYEGITILAVLLFQGNTQRAMQFGS
jgi:hypothetical protein